MLSLYYNTKLFSDNVKPYAASADGAFFYPIIYPRYSQEKYESQLDIFLKSIESLASLKFKNAIFNIDIDDLNDNSSKLLIESSINNFCFAEYIEINFSRPSTVESWKKNIKKYLSIFEKESPVLIVMNHDHMFVDYTDKPFIQTINTIFKESSNLGKAFIYSHCPEVISWIFHSRNDGHYKFYKITENIYKSDVVDDHIDSISIMTMDTLLSIFEKVNLSGDYIGRIEWKGATHSDLGLTFYASPREFFKHYDGYGHISGTNKISDLRSIDKFIPYKEAMNSIDTMANFYYKCWIDAFYLFIRDSLSKHIIFIEPIKETYVKSLEESITIFIHSYIETDTELNLISKDQALLLEIELRNLIYKNANCLFSDVMIDIQLLQPGILSRSKSLLFQFPSFAIQLLKKILMKFIS